MADAFEVAVNVAERLHSLRGEDGTATLANGTAVLISRTGHAALAYEVQPVTAKGQNPNWFVAATDDEACIDPPYLGVQKGDQHFSTADRIAEVPDWAMGVLNNILAIEQTA